MRSNISVTLTRCSTKVFSLLSFSFLDLISNQPALFNFVVIKTRTFEVYNKQHELNFEKVYIVISSLYQQYLIFNKMRAVERIY